MRAAMITEIGESPEVADRPDPQPDDELVMLAMEAVALNPVDIAIASGSFYAGHPAPPYVPCLEGAGRTPDGRLMYAQGGGRGITSDGFAAERVAAPASILTEVPNDLDPGIAAALGTAGLAGWLSVTWRGGVEAGDRVVVLGASGAVGNIALQAARHGGAERVVAVGRDVDRLNSLADRADATVPLGDDLATRIADAAEGQPTLVIDMLWGSPLEAVLPALAAGARIVQVGASAGPSALVASAAVRGKQLELRGYSNFAVPPDIVSDAYRTMTTQALSGDLDVPVRSFPLTSIAEAWNAATAGSEKIVVDMGAKK